MSEREPIAEGRPSDGRAFSQAMSLRRWFLILATPVVLLLTVFAVLQWRWVWRILMP